MASHQRLEEEEQQAREGLVRVGRGLAATGLNTGLSGNMSVRLCGGYALVTPAGVEKGRLGPEAMVLVNAEGQPVGAGQGKLSSEWPMHRGIYQVCSRAGAVVHAHPAAATVVSMLAGPINLCVTAEGAAVLGPVALVSYRRPGTNDLAQAVAQAAASSSTILLGQHGAVTVGETLDQAMSRMETLEHVCRIYLEARRQQALTVLPDEEVRALRALFGFDVDAPTSIFVI